jgi:hypothetical protein
MASGERIALIMDLHLFPFDPYIIDVKLHRVAPAVFVGSLSLSNPRAL